MSEEQNEWFIDDELFTVPDWLAGSDFLRKALACRRWYSDVMGHVASAEELAFAMGVDVSTVERADEEIGNRLEFHIYRDLSAVFGVHTYEEYIAWKAFIKAGGQA